MIIQAPASSANLGPGFDSIGIAVSLYLKLEVLGPSDNWQVDHQLGKLPHDETNMIVATALSVAPDLLPQHLRVVSEIPIAHGLGSSSSACSVCMMAKSSYPQGLALHRCCLPGASIPYFPVLLLPDILLPVPLPPSITVHPARNCPIP